MKLSDKKRIALVLSGGGVKAAAFHIGVCLALREKGFRFAGGNNPQDRLTFEGQSLTFTIYVGSSAGSVVATSWLPATRWMPSSMLSRAELDWTH